MKKIMASVLSITMMTAVLTGCASTVAPNTSADVSTVPKEENYALKLAENQPDNNPVTQGMYKLAELAKEKTGGSITIDVYPNAQLGQEDEVIEQVQAGVLDMARVNTVPLASIIKELEAFTLPYVFINNEHKYKVLDGEIGQEILKAFEVQNMVGLGFVETGARHFYTAKKPIRAVEDMKGMKIRVQKSESAIKMVELLGGVATPMDYGEVFQALQTGVIDGAENDFVSCYTSGHYEAIKYLSLDGHMAPPATVIISKKIWDTFTEEQKSAMMEASKEAIDFQRIAMNDFQDESRKIVEDSGVEVIDVDVKEFQTAVESMYQDYPNATDILEKMKALQ